MLLSVYIIDERVLKIEGKRKTRKLGEDEETMSVM